MKQLLNIYWTFAKMGACCFGGGYAMLSLLQRIIVEQYHWATEEELMDYYAIGQCTPGVIAVNTATFVGNKNRGLAGGIAATLGVVAPSVLIITIIAAFIRNFAELAVVQNAFAGVRVAVCILIFNAVVKLWQKAVVDKPTIVIAVSVFILSAFTELSTVFLVVTAGILGVLLRVLLPAVRKNKKEGN